LGITPECWRTIDRSNARDRFVPRVSTPRRGFSDRSHPACVTGCPSTERATVMFPRVAFE
jgi:hypothetical protein